MTHDSERQELHSGLMQGLTQTSLRHDMRRSAIHQPGAWRTPVMIFIVTSVLAVALKPLLAGEVSSGLIFVLGITLVGANAGLVPALVASVLAAAFFNFFLADPVLTFRMSTGNDLAPPVIFTACAIVSGLLAGRLRDRTFLLGQANLQLESLLETSRMLQAAPDIAAIEKALARTLPGRLGFRLSVFGVQEGKLRRFNLADQRRESLDLAERAVLEKAVLQEGARTAFSPDYSPALV